MVLVAEPTCARDVDHALADAGITVRYRDLRAGLFLVIASPRRLVTLARIPGIQAVRVKPRSGYDTVNTRHPVDSAAARWTGQRAPLRLPIPRVDTTWAMTAWAHDSANRPYFAAAEMGLERLRAKRPDADGRGTRVAVTDEGIDLLHPALREALDAQGHVVPKVADVEVPTDFVLDAGQDASWVAFADSAVVRAHGSDQPLTMTALGRVWRVPHAGGYRMGIFARQVRFNYQGTGSPLIAGVLFEPATGQVWVDTKGEGDFSHVRAVHAYHVAQEFGWFGERQGDRDDRVPFTVQLDPRGRGAYLRIVVRPHGTLVAGPLAANRRTGGLFDGAAPAAQLIDAADDGLEPGIAVFLHAAARPDIDVINRSGHFGVPFDFEDLIIGRLLAIYHKPIVMYGTTPGVIFGMDYTSAEMLRRNRQAPPPWIESTTSYPPWRLDGTLNVLLAPSANLGTAFRAGPLAVRDSLGQYWNSYRPSTPAPAAPSGYMINANMSPTIPVISGVLADLIGLARHDHVPYNDARLIDALDGSARLIAGFSIREQGNGLVQADAAWHLLRQMARADAGGPLTHFDVLRAVDPTRTDAAAPRAATVGFLEDWSESAATSDSPRPPISRAVWVIRRGGPSAARAYRLRWRANDGVFAFASDTAVTVRRDEAIEIVVRVTPAPGVHAAFLQLVDAPTGAVMHHIPVTVRWPHRYTTAVPFVRVYADTIPPRRVHDSFFGIAATTQAVRVTVTAPKVDSGVWSITSRSVQPPFDEGAWQFAASLDTATVARDSTTVDPVHHVGPLETVRWFAADAVPGMWRVFDMNRGYPEYEAPREPPAPTVPIVSTYRVEEFAVRIGRAGPSTWDAVNTQAAVTGSVVGYAASLGYATVHVPHDSVWTAPVQIPAGTAALRVRAHVTADDQAAARDTAADVFVLNCTATDGACHVVAHAPVTGDTGRTVSVRNPEEGVWRYALVPRWVRSPTVGAITATVTDAVVGDHYGTVSVADSITPRASGATWRVSVVPMQSSDPGLGRQRAVYAAFRMAPDSVDSRDAIFGLTAMTPGAP